MAIPVRRRNSFYRTLKNVEPDLDDVVFDRGLGAAKQNKWLFEVAWEVANKGRQVIILLLQSL